MKKSVIFLIGIIYIMSIVVVTFFGLQPGVDQFQIYLDNITITTYDFQSSSGQKYKNVEFDTLEGSGYVKIEYEFGPENASYPYRVKYSLVGNTSTDENGVTTTFATVNNFGEVTFINEGSVILTITALDGSKVSDSVTIFCVKNT